MRKQNGYSLIELLGVLLIVGIVVAVAAPNLIRANRNYQLYAAAQNVAQAFQAAKYDAVGANGTKSVIVNTANNTVTTSGGKVITLPKGIKFASLAAAAESPATVQSACGNSGKLKDQKGNAALAVSLPAGDKANTYKMEFISRGLPAVEPGVVNWIYLTNETGEKVAVTITSAGVTEVWCMVNNQWAKK